MNPYAISVKPFGEEAVLIEWPNRVEEAILKDILEFNKYLQEKLPGSGRWEQVPAYNSLTLINNKEGIDFEDMKKKLLGWYTEKKAVDPAPRYLWTLPVCYTPEYGEDLKEVADLLDYSVEELIAEHTAHNYTVYGIGFLPGFMYLGGIPKALETPRRSTPRLKVPSGSVGLAGKQTGIYPQESPGGWNIIGNCPIPIFDVTKNPPSFVSVGDKIRFYSITQGEYDLRKIEGEVGIYKPEKELLDD
ncbi:5-oxoprolinase subunit PxpB [Poritiphilus flavus]|uniref:5-oxoprolinase subunit PxpB n=1 Tax=Poritiphilus flavus TaxID=2697053 RepID=A0A6L9EEE0_9FLAO|nr:5-oxoprolinase subunit PxpB [Poritiphilus flavus]NAS13087.1 5-oxoprolinase subunit PxpB [Poritiphilus flavus]